MRLGLGDVTSAHLEEGFYYFVVVYSLEHCGSELPSRGHCVKSVALNGDQG